MSQGRPMCRTMASDRLRALPQLGRRPIEQGGQFIHPSFSQPADVSGNAPLVLTAGSSGTTWTVDTGFASRHRFPLAPTGPSTNPRVWYGVGLSDVPPWGDSRVEAPHKSSPWTFWPALLAYSDYRGVLLR